MLGRLGLISPSSFYVPQVNRPGSMATFVTPAGIPAAAPVPATSMVKSVNLAHARSSGLGQTSALDYFQPLLSQVGQVAIAVPAPAWLALAGAGLLVKGPTKWVLVLGGAGMWWLSTMLHGLS